MNIRLFHCRVLTSIVVAMLITACGEQNTPTTQSAVEDTAAAAPIGPMFDDIAAQTGLEFEHFVGATGEFLMSEVMGSGVALMDYDNDGDLDVYLIQGAMADPRRSLSESIFDPPDGALTNRLFRNERIPSGTLSFTDVSEISGLDHDGYGMGVAVGDIDNDGDADVYLTNFGPNVLYRNNGDGTFEDITDNSGIRAPGWTTSAAFADFDRDGDLDLFSVDYVAFDVLRNTECSSVGGRRDYCGPQVYPPMADQLYENLGDGRFRDISATVGVAGATGPGLGVVWADFNGDDWPDVFVANDGAANFLWLNENGKRFEEAGLRSGTAYNAMGGAEASMGVTAGDYDSDGDMDLFMTHLVQETNTLYVNNGNAQFFDGTDRAGLGASSLPSTGFGARFFDLNNDGWLDLFIANGNVKLEEKRVAVSDYPLEQPNQLFIGKEGRFQDVSLSAGESVNELRVSRGAAFGDIDDDGAIDVVVTNNNGPVRLMRNVFAPQGRALTVHLQGTESSRDATGARVALLRDDQPPIWRRVSTDGSYLSANAPSVHFGLGDRAEARVTLGVIWPLGKKETFSVPTDRTSTLEEGTGQSW
ncbi:MAG: CRTAC1 family protein [Pseudomonadota bacterium]